LTILPPALTAKAGSARRLKNEWLVFKISTSVSASSVIAASITRNAAEGAVMT